jgi:hypothetical protein
MELALSKIIDRERGPLAAAVEIVSFLASEGVHVWWCDVRKVANEDGFEDCSREAFPCTPACGCRWAIDLQDHVGPKYEDRPKVVKL